MSRRTYWTTDYEIVAGWDPPLQHYFVEVYMRDAHPDDDPVYTSLDDPDHETFTLAQVCDVLHVLRRPMPPAMLADLQEDQRVNRGNAEAIYTVLS